MTSEGQFAINATSTQLVVTKHEEATAQQMQLPKQPSHHICPDQQDVTVSTMTCQTLQTTETHQCASDVVNKAT